MSFKAKTTAVTLVVMTIVYGWYFLQVLLWASTTPVEEVFYQGVLFAMVVVLVILFVVGMIVLAVVDHREADEEDERDRLIEMRGDQVGNYTLAVAVFVAMGLAMTEVAYFWIANALLAGLVLSELAKGAVMLVAYRRGF
jgi:heme/copper-type cytochrome/quinol oxidase subunit 2